MDVFRLRDELTREYADFVRSFVIIRDERLRGVVDRELDDGLLWPDPFIQLNPNFESAGTVDDLVAEGVLHGECARIFRVEKGTPKERPIRFHRHQAGAIRAARTGASYVLTTGTGSGKSLAYITPIVDRVLRDGPNKGIKAIVVYPMNALANSQFGELAKFLNAGYPDNIGPVRFARFTGQESEEERQAIKANPPDILLTNYVMLDLLLTRQWDKQIVRAAEGLKFLVLDELHTYRGRQGADVALLVRRVREAGRATDLQCVGTSATLAGAGSAEGQQREIAELAQLVFGTPVMPANVILETLERVTEPAGSADPAFREKLRDAVAAAKEWPEKPAFEEFIKDPLVRWIEGVVGLEPEQGTERLVRARPRPVTGPDGMAIELAALTGLPDGQCTGAIQRTLLAGYRVRHPEKPNPVFAFRLHQFYSRGETVYATLEAPGSRTATVHEQRFAPGDRSKILLPMAFCRVCGQDYFVVSLRSDESGTEVIQRDLFQRTVSEGERAGFLFVAEGERAWPEDTEEAIKRLPEEWFEEGKTGAKLKSAFRDQVPKGIRLSSEGRLDDSGEYFAFLPSPLRFCPQCDVSYPGRGNDIARLATLGVGGRASATSILSAAALRRLRHEVTLREDARKLLSFTDNRQDASLQAGHFNDFVQVGLLRSALHNAAESAAHDGLPPEELGQRVFDALAFEGRPYSANPDERFAARDGTDKTMRDVIAYRLYRDLERGWRITAPNLEQCGLLRFEYLSLDEACAADDLWQQADVLQTASVEERKQIAVVLLDLLRRELAIKTTFLTPEFQEALKQRASTALVAPWGIDEDEELERRKIAYPTTRPRNERDPSAAFVSPYGLYGRYLRRRFRQLKGVEDTQLVIGAIFRALREAGLLHEVVEGGFQVPDAAMRWIAADGSKPAHDPLRMARPPEDVATNRYFVGFYKSIASDGKGLEGREHTAAVKAEVREEREQRFREGKLPAMFCSPTMELGVDISDLSVVNMRNVPPTPANYAQRSGRAGRSGQPALVFTYCTTGSSHDQYYFRAPLRMVSGQVSPPKIDLTNEDLVKSHCHAIWLSETGVDLKSSMSDVLDLGGEEPTLELQPSISDGIQRQEARIRAHTRASAVLASIPALSDADWYSDTWLEHVLESGPGALDAAADRWRGLYKAALETSKLQNKLILDVSKSQEEKKRARRLRAQAESQLDLLRAEGEEARRSQSDFYTYRYFASEGFLPGYAFPRLPLSAFIPGRRGAKGNDEFLQRPRFLAVSEFGPRALVYHEGSRYVVDRVILPAERTDDNALITEQAKQCGDCGYLHIADGGLGADTCTRCKAVLDATVYDRLFRLRNVSTIRRDRITSDEEERQRQGFEIRTGVQFARARNGLQVRRGDVLVEDRPVARLEYAPAATIWRINLGWNRRKNRDEFGFEIDTQSGRWQRNQNDPNDDNAPALGPVVQRVVPYVEDRRNSLLFEPGSPLSDRQMASLAAALRRAIQAEFQLEEVELAVEPLPTPGTRNVLLFFESAEGGAGVVRRLVADSDALAKVARTALELCHFDPDTGDDRGKAVGAREECTAACYDCLMSYTNQLDHGLLDRALIKDTLVELARATVRASGGAKPYADHLAELLRLCDSKLEQRLVRWLDQHGYALPDKAQVRIESCKPDFLYEEDRYSVFIDGPVHEYKEIEARDAAARARLMDAGWGVIVFGDDDSTWSKVVAEYPTVFGKGSK